MNKTNNLYFLPLGGTGEIGMNLNLYGVGPTLDAAQWIIVDMGVSFSSKDRAFSIEMTMPDPAFIEKRRKNLLGIILTHIHEDHIGAVPHLWSRLNCPVYASSLAACILKDKFFEKGLSIDHALSIIPPQAPMHLGPFTVEFVEITHSTLESNALIIQTQLGTVYHTGDWKIDDDPILGHTTNFGRLKEIGKQGVLAVIGDSTNAMNEGHSGSEGKLADSLTELIASVEGGLAVTTFASNIARLYTLIRAAEQCGRKVVLAGRSMYRAINAARDVGYLTNLPDILTEDSIARLDKGEYMIICTGSQGEERAALARIANGTHPNIHMGKGDTVIFSSRIIPGNDLVIFGLQNKLAAQGIHVITERDHFVHVSGHPCRGELAHLYKILKPQIVVPVHGEMRHMLEHAGLAQSLGTPHTPLIANGKILQLAPGAPHVVEQTGAGRLHLDGNQLITDDDQALHERRVLARQGLVIVNLILDRSDNLVEDPNIHFIGIPLALEDVQEPLMDAIFDFMESLARQKKQASESNLRKNIARAIQTTIASFIDKQPMVRVYFVRR